VKTDQWTWKNVGLQSVSIEHSWEEQLFGEKLRGDKNREIRGSECRQSFRKILIKNDAKNWNRS
jgi:hypothetical protein